MLYLSQAIGRPVLDVKGESIGKVDDLIVALGDRYPPVTGLVVATDRRRIFLPWSHVASFDGSGARLSTGQIDITKFQGRPNEIQLRADLLDKQIVDIDGRKVVRVNDLRLDDVEGKLHLVAVDVGAAGLLRRLGIEGGYRVAGPQSPPADARAVHRLGGRRPGRVERGVDQAARPARRPQPSSIRRTSRRSSTSSTPRDRAGVIAALDDEAAADAIEEMEPETQVEVLEDAVPRARRRHPRGDESRRRRRPRRRPRPDDARRDPGAHGGRRGRGGPGAARLPRGLGRRDHDHRVHRARRVAHGRRVPSIACASSSPTPRPSTTCT